MNAIRHSIAVAALASAVAAQQQIVLPDNHHFGESPNQTGSPSNPQWWRSTAGRFQLIYDASHFLDAGVTGPITINRLKFRAEDAQFNNGGQVFNGVTIELGATTVTPTAMSATFAANRAPALPDSTTMGPLGTTNVTVAAAPGQFPNAYIIDIDLAAIGASFSYDPSSGVVHLLIDITIPNAPANNTAPSQLVAMQDTTGGLPVVRGQGVTTNNTASATGTLSTAPPVVALEFSGTGGYAAVIPARNAFFGAGCGGSASTFYQAFVNGDAWDISGLTLTPDNASTPTYYGVSASAPAPDLTKVGAAALSTGDENTVTYSLGFTFNYPGGSTSAVRISNNGFVWLDTTPTAADASPEVNDLLGNSSLTNNRGPRLAPYWKDLHCGRNVLLNPLAGLHAVTDTSTGPGTAVCYITWWDVADSRVVGATGVYGHSVETFQCVLHEATGMVEFRYGTMPSVVGSQIATPGSNPVIVGFSRGRIGTVASVDPQNRDLSAETPFNTAVEGATGNMGLRAVATPFAGGAQYGGRFHEGQNVTWNVVNVPAGAIFGIVLLDFVGYSPGLQAPGITAPGCMLSVGTSILWESVVSPPATYTGTTPVVMGSGYDPSYHGVEFFAQFLLLDGLFNPSLAVISASSNTIRHTMGLQ